jgi:hypothetical protein
MWDVAYYPVPQISASVIEPPLRQICINEQWAALLAMAVDRFAYADAWQGNLADDAVLLANVQEIISALEIGNCEETLMANYRLREKPGDKCQVQQSYDAGETWHDAWRNDRCAPDSVYAYLTMTAGDTYTENVTEVYDGTPESVATVYPPDYGAPNSISDKVLCYAIERYVASCSEAAIAIHQGTISETQEALTLGSLILGLIAAVALSPFTAGTSLAAYGWHIGFAGAVLAAGSELLDEIRSKDVSFWSDTDALQRVRCEMYNSLRGGGTLPTFSEWKNSVSGSDFDDDPEKLMAKWIYQCNQQQDDYLGFLTYLDDLAAIQDRIPAGDFPSCICQCADEADWTWSYDIASTEARLNAAVADGTLTILNGAVGYGEKPFGMSWGVIGAENGTNNFEAEIRVTIPAQSVGKIARISLGLWTPLSSGCGSRDTVVELDATQGRVFETTVQNDILTQDNSMQLEIAAYLDLTELYIMARGSCEASNIYMLKFEGCGSDIFAAIGLA